MHEVTDSLRGSLIVLGLAEVAWGWRAPVAGVYVLLEVGGDVVGLGFRSGGGGD